jgi:hypothetical protein
MFDARIGQLRDVVTSATQMGNKGVQIMKSLKDAPLQN